MCGDPNDFTLFLVLDGDNTVGDYNGKYGYGPRSFKYVDEAVLCVKSWRKNGGKLKDIQIVCYVPTDKFIPKSGIEELESFGVNCSFTYTIDRNKYPCGYWNVPFVGEILEQSINNTKYIIHIDLDMYLIREIPIEYLIPSPTSFAKIAINENRPTDQPNVNITPIYPKEINTGFIVTRTDSHFYTNWWKYLYRKCITLDVNDPNYSIWEERICDVMYYELDYKFDFFEKFQLNGEVSEYNLEELEHLYFIHGHLDLIKRNEHYLKKYIKRLIQLKEE